MKFLLKISFLFFFSWGFSQPKTIEVFKNENVRFSSEKKNPQNMYLSGGRLVVKKVKAPIYKKGTDVSVELKLTSNGDPWDKSGSLFVVKDTNSLNIINIAKGETFDEASKIANTNAIVKTEQYTPAVEILRFMTPFGVGHFSDQKLHNDTKYYRPVSVPSWEDKVVWKQDISHLQTLLQGEFYIGIWIDTWTKEGYNVDVSLHYSSRDLAKKEVLPLVNTIYYIDGQKIPDFFAEQPLNLNFNLKKDAKNAYLYYITTGHGGHSGGDEFVKKQNSIFFNENRVFSFIPWRNDCASFRRFNPSSGVWAKKDTAMFFNENREREKRVIVERIASSDLSRSNWCPGSDVVPQKIFLGNIKKGNHQLKIEIPATKNKENQQNHWLVSAYLVYE